MKSSKDIVRSHKLCKGHDVTDCHPTRRQDEAIRLRGSTRRLLLGLKRLRMMAAEGKKTLSEQSHRQRFNVVGHKLGRRQYRSQHIIFPEGLSLEPRSIVKPYLINAKSVKNIPDCQKKHCTLNAKRGWLERFPTKRSRRQPAPMVSHHEANGQCRRVHGFGSPIDRP